MFKLIKELFEPEPTFGDELEAFDNETREKCSKSKEWKNILNKYQTENGLTIVAEDTIS